MSIYSLAGGCADCGSNECSGCDLDREEQEDPCPGGWIDPKLSKDPRDFTPAPKVTLDPRFILRNRERTQKYLDTGEFDFPRGKDWSR